MVPQFENVRGHRPRLQLGPGNRIRLASFFREGNDDVEGIDPERDFRQCRLTGPILTSTEEAKVPGEAIEDECTAGVFSNSGDLLHIETAVMKKL